MTEDDIKLLNKSHGKNAKLFTSYSGLLQHETQKMSGLPKLPAVEQINVDNIGKTSGLSSLKFGGNLIN